MAKQKVQGEGDYEATRRYRKRTERFLKHHDVEKAADQAAPRDAEEERQMREAESAGRRRARH
jgi:hypothetical protein